MAENTPTRMGGVSADDMIAILIRERDEAQTQRDWEHGYRRAVEAERDTLDCTLREGGDTRHCRPPDLCQRCQLDRLRVLLREVEWVEAWDDEGAEWWFCAVCRCDKSDGHARDCRLAAALEGRDA